MDMPSQPDMAPDMAPEGAYGKGSTEIVLAIADDDGGLSVCLKKDGAEQERQDVQDIGGALRAVLDIYKRASASLGGDPGKEFDSGFSGQAKPGMGR